MSNVIPFPVIAGIEITTDEQGRFNLNALHKASGLGKHKAPNKWLENKQAQELIAELSSQTPNSGSALNVNNGGKTPGTFAHELLAISYAGWISPAFQLKVNQVFIDYRTGKLSPTPTAMTRTEILQLAMEAEKENQRLALQVQDMTPKAEFHDRVTRAVDAHSVREAAKILRTGEKRLFQFLREQRLLMQNNQPYQTALERGWFRVIEKTYVDEREREHVYPQTLITGKGMIYLQHLLDNRLMDKPA